MCPQCNLSSTMLTCTQETAIITGDSKVEEAHSQAAIRQKYPKTVAGYFINFALRGNEKVPAEDWLMPVNKTNKYLPANLHLFCGDRSLDQLVGELTKAADGPIDGVINQYRVTHVLLRTFIDELQSNFRAKDGKELVVFIDTNPALSIYTQIALVAMTELIIPINANSYSEQAIRNMFHLVYGLYPTTGRAQHWEQTTFASRARAYGVNVPQIACIINNKTPVNQEGNAMWDQLAASHAECLFDGYKRARDHAEGTELSRAFKPRSPAGAREGTNFTNAQVTQFSQEYCINMRDMLTFGVASGCCGLPAYLLEENAILVDRHFPNTTGLITKHAKPIMKDMWQLIKKVFWDVLMEADANRIADMERQGEDQADGDGDGGNGGNGGNGDDGHNGGGGGAGGGQGGGGSGGAKRGRTQ